MTNVSTRQSNFELFRIVCMIGVLLNHTLQALWNLHVSEISMANEFRIFLLNLSQTSANCFILISGYFTIRLSWRGVVKYYLQCFFYAAIIVTVSALINRSFTLHDFSQIIFASSENCNYFIRCYFALMLLSPILNKAIQAMTDNEMRMAVCLLLIVDVYLGYMHQIWEIASVGEELMHMVTMYFVGSRISRMTVSYAPWGWFAVVMALLMTVFHMIKMRFFPISIIYSLHNNSPSVLVLSVMLFLWARTWKLQSPIVNWFAGGVFAVYIIHSNPYFSPYYWQMMRSVRDMGTWYISPVLVVGTSAVMFCVFTLFDKLRAGVFRSLESAIADKLSCFFSKISGKMLND